ncbi:hypothetical protein DFH09DRAFT_1110891 [Mycena vulgaris]|nr:hypothetical protein DFH09DRAFT_1110891 [Mycena vulgaris]
MGRSHHRGITHWVFEYRSYADRDAFFHEAPYSRPHRWWCIVCRRLVARVVTTSSSGAYLEKDIHWVSVPARHGRNMGRPSYTIKASSWMLHPFDPYGPLTQSYAGTAPDALSAKNGVFLIPWARDGPIPTNALTWRWTEVVEVLGEGVRRLRRAKTTALREDAICSCVIKHNSAPHNVRPQNRGQIRAGAMQPNKDSISDCYRSGPQQSAAWKSSDASFGPTRRVGVDPYEEISQLEVAQSPSAHYALPPRPSRKAPSFSTYEIRGAYLKIRPAGTPYILRPTVNLPAYMIYGRDLSSEYQTFEAKECTAFSNGDADAEGERRSWSAHPEGGAERKWRLRRRRGAGRATEGGGWRL